MNIATCLRNLLVAATLTGFATSQRIFVGSPRDDVFGPYSSSDVYIGNEGNDWLEGGDGYDDIDGGTGDDVLIGGADDDRLWGGEGNDIIIDDAGADVIKAAWDNEVDIIYCVDADPDDWFDVIDCDAEDIVICDAKDLITVWEEIEDNWTIVFQGTGAEYYEWLANGGR